MIQIILSPEQTDLIQRATEPIEVRDSHGQVFGYLAPRIADFTADEIAEAQRRRAQPGVLYTTAEVLEELRQLESQ